MNLDDTNPVSNRDAGPSEERRLDDEEESEKVEVSDERLEKPVGDLPVTPESEVPASDPPQEDAEEEDEEGDEEEEEEEEDVGNPHVLAMPKKLQEAIRKLEEQYEVKNIKYPQKRCFIPTGVVHAIEDTGDIGEYVVEGCLQKLSEAHGNFFSFNGISLKPSKGKNITGEMDFLLIHPVLGLVIIEVKENSQAAKKKNSRRKAEGQLKRVPGDFVNVILDEYSDDTARDTIRPKLENFMKNVPLYVAMPQTERKNEEKPKRDENLEVKLLFQEDFVKLQTGEKLLFGGKDIDKKLYEEVYPVILATAYRLKSFTKDPAGINLAKTTQIINATERKLTSYHMDQHEGIYESPEQLSLLDPFNEKRLKRTLWITGPAGSGKTHILMEKMRRTIEDPENKLKCLFLCCNPALRDRVKDDMSRRVKGEDTGKYEVMTLNDFLDHLMPFDLAFMKPTEYEEMVKAYHFFIDEYQGFYNFDKNRSLVYRIITYSSGLRWIVFDASQMLDPDLTGSPYKLPENVSESDVVYLPTVYRGTLPILEFANRLRIPSKYDIMVGPEDLRIACAVDNGHKPELIRYEDSPDEELKKLLTHLKEEGINMKEDIIILSAPCFSSNARRGVSFYIGGVEWEAGTSFLGLERNIVIVVSDHDWHRGWNDFQRRLYYIACTRARSRLYVIAPTDPFDYLVKIQEKRVRIYDGKPRGCKEYEKKKNQQKKEKKKTKSSQSQFSPSTSIQPTPSQPTLDVTAQSSGHQTYEPEGDSTLAIRLGHLADVPALLEGGIFRKFGRSSDV